MRSTQIRNDPSQHVRMTHIILSPLFPPSRFGGIEKIVDRLAHGLAETQDNVLLFTFDPNPASNNDSSNSLLITRINCPIINGSLTAIMGHQQAMIDRVIASSIPTGARILHAHDWFVAGAAIELRSLLKAPLIAFFHGDKRSEYSGLLDGDRMTIHSLQHRLAHEADLVLCYSSFMRSCLSSSLGLFPEKIAEFRCGMDEDTHLRDASKLPESPRILYLGRLAKEKDVATLIHAFRQVLTLMPHCRLRIIGDGSEWRSLEVLANAINVADRVDFRPFTSNPDTVDCELRHANALVLPSVFEPFGMVILEAISRGVPVIVPSIGGPAEIVENDVTGFMFTPGDAGELAERILTCLNDTARAEIIAKTAHQHVSTHFRWSQSVLAIRGYCLDLSLKSFAIGGLS